MRYITLLASLMCALAALAQTPASQTSAVAQTPAPAAPAPLTFEFNDLNLSVTVADPGWVAADEQTKKGLEQAAKMQAKQRLLVLLTRPSGAQTVERFTLITTALPESPGPVGHVAEDYLKTWGDAQPTFELVKDKKVESPSNWYFATGVYKSKSAPERWIGVLATVQHNQLMKIQADLNSEGELDKLLAALKIDIAPDYRNDKEPVQPPSAAPKPGTFDVSDVMKGKIIRRVQPEYPTMARAARIQGAVTLQGVISTHGKISMLRVMGGHPVLVPAAIDAVKRWEYQPFMVKDQPIDIETAITVEFQLRR